MVEATRANGSSIHKAKGVNRPKAPALLTSAARNSRLCESRAERQPGQHRWLCVHLRSAQRIGVQLRLHPEIEAGAGSGDRARGTSARARGGTLVSRRGAGRQLQQLVGRPFARKPLPLTLAVLNDHLFEFVTRKFQQQLRSRAVSL